MPYSGADCGENTGIRMSGAEDFLFFFWALLLWVFLCFWVCARGEGGAADGEGGGDGAWVEGMCGMTSAGNAGCGRTRGFRNDWVRRLGGG